MPKPRIPSPPTKLDRYTQRFAQLRQELLTLQYFCKGTVLERRMKCGQPGCACHADPSKRHGPYWEWTYKSQAKTINVRLSPATGPIYKRASQQYRKLKSLLGRLERVSRAALGSLAKKAASDRNNRAEPKATQPG
jgi:hypothetical protein